MEPSPFSLTQDVIEPGDEVFVLAGNGVIWTTVTAVVLSEEHVLYLVPTIPGALTRDKVLTRDEFNERN